MINQIFVNLHVSDLEKSKKFFEGMGFTINQQFTDETGSCVVFSDSIFAMLLTRDKFKMFTPKAISDAHESTEVITAFGVGSRIEVDALVDKAIAMGATPTRPPEDHGFMYGRSFNDLDGHIWEVFYMDLSQFPKS